MLETTKQCTKCGKIKTISEFSIRRNRPSGVFSACKECCLIAVNKSHREINGVISRIYSGQKHTSKKRGHVPPSYTKDEFTQWILSQDNFLKLYNYWVASDYKTNLRPSVDRKEDLKPYTMDNIQLVSWTENLSHYRENRKSGIDNRQSKAVSKHDLDNNFISSYYSMAEAGRIHDIARGNIVECCKERRKTAGGFKWKYATKETKCA